MKMLMLLFIVVIFTVGDVTSVSDEEFQELKDLLNQQIIRNDQQDGQLMQQDLLLEQQGALLSQQVVKIDRQDQVITDQAVKITQLEQALGFFPADDHKKIVPMENSYSKDDPKTFQNLTLEERVSLLELQMIETQDDINSVEQNIDGVEQDVDFLEDEQFLQDQRIYDLEQNVDLVSQDVLDLQATTITLDYRVTSLEENGGGNANITQLETRVTELEILTLDQGISIDINEENIQGLQSSDAALEARVTDLEENNGGGGGNETSIAFFAVVPDSPIQFDTNVLFSEVLINDENGYNPSTGTFTVPSGGDGLYYFSTYLLVYYNEIGYFNIRVNGLPLCTAWGENESNGGDDQQATCSGLAQLTEGDEVSLVYDAGSDTTPLYRSSTYHFNGFSGFRL